MKRPSALGLILVLVAACGASEGPATLTVTTVGQPAAAPIGGSRLEVQLVSDGVVQGTWAPSPNRSVENPAGRYELVLRDIGLADTVVCIDSIVPGEGGCKRQETPPSEVCRVDVELAPGSETVVGVVLDSGPVCRVVPG